MGINYSTIIITVVNFVLLLAAIVVIYKVAQAFKDFIRRNKRMENKINVILKKLENKEDKQ